VHATRRATRRHDSAQDEKLYRGADAFEYRAVRLVAASSGTPLRGDCRHLSWPASYVWGGWRNAVKGGGGAYLIVYCLLGGAKKGRDTPDNPRGARAASAEMLSTACPSPQHSTRLGVLGVLSTDRNAVFRTEIRSSWLRVHSWGIETRFVLRRTHSPMVLAEARARRDILFVPSFAATSRAAGPIRSLIGWFRCALHAWPSTRFIGKADDDIWANLRAISAALHGALLHSRGPRMVFGVLEPASWDSAARAPIILWGHLKNLKGYEGRLSNCTNSPSTAGPFPMPKGPLFFLSRTLVADTIGALSAEGPKLIASAVERGASDLDRRRNGSGHNGRLPFEDVWMGSVLARTVTHDVTTVNLGLTSLGESLAGAVSYSSYVLRPSSILWHETKYAGRKVCCASSPRTPLRPTQRCVSPPSLPQVPWRLRWMEQWAAANACAPSEPQSMNITCPAVYRSCAGALWRQCVHTPPPECSTHPWQGVGRGLST
jgi:hypothetical protein